MSIRFPSSFNLANPSTQRELLKVAVVTVAAVVGVVLFAHLYDIGVKPALQIIAVTLLSALVTTMLGVVVIYAFRRRSIGSQAGLLFAIAGSGAALASWVNAHRMFLSEHDLGVLMMVLTIAGATACYGAIAFGRRVNNSIGRLIRGTREVTTASTIDISNQDDPQELALLASEIEAMSVRLTTTQMQSDSIDRSRRELVSWITGDVEARLQRIESAAEAASPEVAAQLRAEAAGIRTTVADVTELLKDPSVPHLY